MCGRVRRGGRILAPGEAAVLRLFNCRVPSIWGVRRYDGTGLIWNARSEKVNDRYWREDNPALLEVDAFYEREGSGYTGFQDIHGETLILAALRRESRFVVLTMPSTTSMVSMVHHRMPVIFRRDHELHRWLEDRILLPDPPQLRMAV